MIDDSAALRARLAAVTAERDALKAQADHARRVWTTSEISGMDHEAYLAREREVLAALREGRVRRDDAPQAVQPAFAVPDPEHSPGDRGADAA